MAGKAPVPAAAPAADLKGPAWCAANQINWPTAPAILTAALADACAKDPATMEVFFDMSNPPVPADERAGIRYQLHDWADRMVFAGGPASFDVVGPAVFKRIQRGVGAPHELRECQVAAAVKSKAYFTNNPGQSKGVIVLPTGCGKSGLIAMLPYAMATPGAVLVVTPRSTIRGQIYKDLKGSMTHTDVNQRRPAFVEKHGLVPAGALPSVMVMNEGQKFDPQTHVHQQIVVANAQRFSLPPAVQEKKKAAAAEKAAKRAAKQANKKADAEPQTTAEKKKKKPSKFLHWAEFVPRDAFQLVLVDEAHHFPSDLWQGIVDHFTAKNPQARVIFLTATPYRSTGERVCLPKELIYEVTFKQAVDRNFIRDLRAVPLPKLEQKSKNTDKQEIAAQLSILRWIQGRLAWKNANWRLPKCRQLATPKHQAIACCNSLSQAHKVEALAKQIGLKAKVFYQDMKATRPHVRNGVQMYDEQGQPRERQVDITDEVLGEFERQEFDLIIVKNMLGEGYDHPPISVTAFFFTPGAAPKASQFMGRGVRRIDKEKTDIHCDVVWSEDIDKKAKMPLRFKEVRDGRFAAADEEEDAEEGEDNESKLAPLRKKDFSKLTQEELCALSAQQVYEETLDWERFFLVWLCHRNVHGYLEKNKSWKQWQTDQRKWRRAGKRDPDHEAATDRLADSDRVIFDCGGTGECLYLSLATAFNLLPDAVAVDARQTHTWREVKSRGLDRLRNLSRAAIEAQSLIDILGALYEDVVFQSHAADNDENWQLAWKYLLFDIYGADDKFGDELVLQSIREAYRVNVTIYSLLNEEHDHPLVTDGFEHSVEIFHQPELHYQAVLPSAITDAERDAALLSARGPAVAAAAVAPPPKPATFDFFATYAKDDVKAIMKAMEAMEALEDDEEEEEEEDEEMPDAEVDDE